MFQVDVISRWIYILFGFKEEVSSRFPQSLTWREWQLQEKFEKFASKKKKKKKKTWFKGEIKTASPLMVIFLRNPLTFNFNFDLCMSFFADAIAGCTDIGACLLPGHVPQLQGQALLSLASIM